MGVRADPLQGEALVRSAWCAIEAHAWDDLPKHFAPEYVRHSGSTTHSFDEFRDLIRAQHEAFPDTKIVLSDFVVADDRVAFRWSATGTHRGRYLDIPPTQKRVELWGITISRVVDGAIVEDWASWNRAYLLEALGIVPIDMRSGAGAFGGAGSTDVDPDSLRAVHRKFGTGVTVVTTTTAEGRPLGLVVNAFSSICLDPPLVLIAVAETAATYPALFENDAIGVNILAHDQRAVAERCARSGGEKFAEIDWHPGANGAPTIAGSAASIEATVIKRIPSYTHTIFVAHVTAASATMLDPLLYLGGTLYDGSALNAAP
jgi:flavin reductase (DIM6/NTAB) family NADH-FMN oxidoreductase RutF/predicted ester cyclase